MFIRRPIRFLSLGGPRHGEYAATPLAWFSRAQNEGQFGSSQITLLASRFGVVIKIQSEFQRFLELLCNARRSLVVYEEIDRFVICFGRQIPGLFAIV